MIIAALAAGLPVPAPPPVTAESLTKPSVDIRCSVLAHDGAIRAMQFRLNGARGYPTGGVPAVLATEPVFVVEQDETGTFATSDALYDDLTGKRFSGRWQDSTLGRFTKGRSLAYLRFFPAEEGNAAVVVEQQAPPFMSAMPRYSYAGMCNSTETLQRPLSAPPAGKESRQ